MCVYGTDHAERVDFMDAEIIDNLKEILDVSMPTGMGFSDGAAVL